MKNALLILAVAIYLSIGGVGTALALNEPGLTTVLDALTENGIQHYYQGHYIPVNESDFRFNPSSNSVKVVAGDEAKWSNNKNIVGYCLVSAPNDNHDLFSYGVFCVGSTAEFSPNGNFEFYIRPFPNVNSCWYTMTSQNTDNRKHVKVYKIDDHCGGGYFLGFEDGDQTGTWDYQDIVIKVQNVNESVPKFPSIALPIGTMLGLIFVISRKRGDL